MTFYIRVKNGIKRRLLLIYNYYFIKIRPIKIMNTIDTIDLIVSKHLSVSRFGDGELRLAFEDYSIGFQDFDEKLSFKLKETLNSKDNNLLICVPHTIYDTNHMTDKAKDFWNQLFFDKRKTYLKIIKNRDRLYGDALFTRIYIDYKNKDYSKFLFKKIKLIWDKKDIVIVEGSESKLGIGNDLFSNAKSISRIICPAENAFRKYDKILDSCIKFCNNKLVLIALGPTATVLAYDLNKKGIQAIDIGHIDIEYEWFLKKSDIKIPIKGKYVNESIGKNEMAKFNANDYNDEIFDIIE